LKNFGASWMEQKTVGYFCLNLIVYAGAKKLSLVVYHVVIKQIHCSNVSSTLVPERIILFLRLQVRDWKEGYHKHKNVDNREISTNFILNLALIKTLLASGPPFQVGGWGWG